MEILARMRRKMVIPCPRDCRTVAKRNPTANLSKRWRMKLLNATVPLFPSYFILDTTNLNQLAKIMVRRKTGPFLSMKYDELTIVLDTISR